MEEKKIPKGIIAELPVPFEEDGAVDWFGYGRILEGCMAAGCGGYLLGTPSYENRSLSLKEQTGLIADAALAAGRKAEVIFSLTPGSGRQNAEEAYAAYEAGATLLLLEIPEDLGPPAAFRTLKALEGACPLPLSVRYSSGAKGAESYAELSEENRVVAIADCCEKLSEKLLLRDALDRRSRPPAIIGGNEETLAIFSAMRYTGIISRVACCFPEKAVLALRTRNQKESFLLQSKIRALSILFKGNAGISNLKWALHRKGICAPYVRLPLSEPEKHTREAVEKALENF